MTPAPKPQDAALADLLERQPALDAWQAAWAALDRGDGHCMVVSGEAGMGKTSLIDAVQAATATHHPRWLKARCDPLHTPRPLGPLLDLSPEFGPDVLQALQATQTYGALFPALLQWLRQQRPGVALVIEDLHWADEATLDCIRYLARRLAGAPFALVLSLRAEQIDANPPLRQALAALDAGATTRIELRPLSAAATAELARRSGRQSQGLHALTGGNPFYLKQWLAAPADTLPGSLRDAVLAQLSLLSPQARQALEIVACSPGGLELQHLQHLHAEGLQALQQPSAANLLQAQPPWTRLRHELARRVVEEAIPPIRRWDIHRQLLERLQSLGDGPELLARKVHHAAAAGLAVQVWQMAPAAARVAEAAGANRAAVRLLQLALDQAQAQPHPQATPAARAHVWGLLARRLYAIQALAESMQARQQAIDLLHSCGDEAGAAHGLALLALQQTQGPQALTMAHDAMRGLQAAGTAAAPAQWATAHAALAILLANDGQEAKALQHAREAARLAELSGDAECLAETGSIAASVELAVAPTAAAYAQMEQRISDAMARRQPNQAGVPLVNLASVALAHAEYGRVLAVTERGMAFCAERDLDLVQAHLIVRRALALGECARWQEMLATLQALEALPAPPQRQLHTAAILRDRVNGLLGEPASSDTWRAHVFTVCQGQADLIPAFAYVMAAEAAWMRHDPEAGRQLASEGLALAEGPWLPGQLRTWLRLNGGTPPDLSEAEVQTLSLPAQAAEAGNWQQAQALWLDRGCPFQAVLAVLCGLNALNGQTGVSGASVGNSQDVTNAAQQAQITAARQAALSELLRLGAAGAVRVVRRQMQAAGASGVARGPYGHARRDSHGLSQRERQVAELLAAGLSNPQIAAQLHRSERTVEHHVTAVLSKLGVHSRNAVAAELGSGVQASSSLRTGGDASAA